MSIYLILKKKNLLFKSFSCFLATCTFLFIGKKPFSNNFFYMLMFVLQTSFLLILGKLHVIVEFCPGGNLRQFLINSRISSSEENVTKYINLTSTLNYRQLLKLSLDVANGMDHLSSQKVYFL